MMVWNAINEKVGYINHGELKVWKHITNLGHNELKCNGKVVWGNEYTSKFEIKIPVELNSRFDEIVQEIFTKYDNGEIQKGMLYGRPRWYEIGKNVKKDAFDIKKLVDEGVIRQFRNHVSTWYANKLSGRFNQNSARIHSFNDSKLKEMIPYMDEDLKTVVEDIIKSDFKSTENFANYIKCVNDNIGPVLLNVWGMYNNDLIGKVRSGIYYVPHDEYMSAKYRYRRNKELLLKHFQAQKPDEKINGVHPIKVVTVESIEKAEAKRRIENFKNTIMKNRENKVEQKVEQKVEKNEVQANGSIKNFLKDILVKKNSNAIKNQ